MPGRWVGKLRARVVDAAPQNEETGPDEYLLRKLIVIRANEVWAVDTNESLMARGFAYLTSDADKPAHLPTYSELIIKSGKNVQTIDATSPTQKRAIQ